MRVQRSGGASLTFLGSRVWRSSATIAIGDASHIYLYSFENDEVDGVMTTWYDTKSVELSRFKVVSGRTCVS